MNPTYYRPNKNKIGYDQHTGFTPQRPNSHSSDKPPRHFRGRIFVLVCIVIAGLLIFHPQILQAHSNTGSKPGFSKKETVCLDPGHGGSDPGATTSGGDIILTERDINLIVAQQVKQSVEKAGYQVYMTRTSNDTTMSNHDRYTYCNNQHATILVSIHHNYFSDNQVDYATALFYKDSDQALASSILDSVSSKLNITNDNIAQFEDGVLSESTMPAALSEGFFMTNTDEYALLTSPNSTRLSDEAQGIALRESLTT